MGVSKVEYFGNTLIDLTADTVTPESLAYGVTAHNAKGELIVGTMPIVKAGTKVVSVSDSSYYSLFDSAALNTIFGTSGVTYTNDNCVVYCTNGDYNAQGKKIVATYQSSNDRWYIRTTDGTNFTAGSFRVSYICVTF